MRASNSRRELIMPVRIFYVEGNKLIGELEARPPAMKSFYAVSILS
jgi:hypothetical protein